MSDKSGIEWTDATWNPTVGCTKVSAGCDHCYAETLVNRFAGSNSGFPNRFDTMYLRDEKHLAMPLRWRAPKRIFVNSLSDLFHDEVPDEFIARVFTVMALAHWHTYQLLTKRHARMRSLLTSESFRQLLDDMWCDAPDWGVRIRESARHPLDAWPLPNVWLGVSVENQQWADIRIPALLATPAVVRFLSCEPLLGQVEIARYMTGRCPYCDGTARLPGSNWVAQGPTAPNCWHCNGSARRWPSINWVIAGGESGRGARPMDVEWARSLRDQCAAAGVPFLFKQWGEYIPDETGSVRVGKKRAGRYLDGRTWDEYPEPVPA